MVTAESLPSYSPEVVALAEQGPTFDFDAKRYGDVPSGLAQHYDGDATAPYVTLDQSALDPQAQAAFAAFHGYGAQYGGQSGYTQLQYSPMSPQNYQHGQLNPTQPAFMPGYQQQNLAVTYGGAMEPIYSPEPSPSSVFGTSPNGYLDAASYAPPTPYTQAPMSPAPSFPGSPMPGHAFPGPGGLVGTFSPNPYAPAAAYPANNNTQHWGRTVYVGNLPSTASVDELLNLVRFGPIDNVKILPEKSCAFISFLDPTVASAFHSDMLTRRVQLHGQDLKIGWGKNVPMQAGVVAAVNANGATRNVYLGNLDEDTTEQSLRDDLSRFGPIDQVKIVRDKNIGFVHFLSIANAIKVVQCLPNERDWIGKRVNFGKDRCAYVPKNQHQQQAHNLAAAQMAASYTGGFGINLNLPNHLPPGFSMITEPENIGNRTIYLGNLHPETTVEEICNAIRGGILQQVRYIPDKHICFVTFVDPNAALAFYTMSMTQGINIHQRRLKIGWGKHSGPPPPGISMVVQAGGSRNIYIGNIADFNEFNEDRLRTDFGVHGDIELVNLLREKNCAFVNFTQISFAIKALEAIKQDPAYTGLKVAYGKDRCGNLPRQGFGFSRAPSDRSGRSPRRSPASSTGPPATPSPPILNFGNNPQAQLLGGPVPEHLSFAAVAAMGGFTLPTQVTASA